MDNFKLRINEIRFHNNIMRVLREGDVTKVQSQLNALIKLINHPAPIALSQAWMEAVAFKLEPRHNEMVILLHKTGHSKNAIRKALKMSPNNVYKILAQYEVDPFPIEPRLDIPTSEYVTMFIDGLDEYLAAWKGDLV